MNKQKTLLILSLILNLLLILTVSFCVIVYFNFFGLDDKLGIFTSEDENVVVEEEDEVEDETEQVEDEEESNLEVTEWNTYTNEEMGFQFDFPASFSIDGTKTGLAAMTKSYYQEDITNCIYVGPVDGDNKAQIAIGYDPLDVVDNRCFRETVGLGEKKIEVVEMQIGEDIFEGRKLTYTGVDDEQSYINYFFYLDNPNMNRDEYNYFGLQLEFYPEYQDIYFEAYKETLKTFEWL